MSLGETILGTFGTRKLTTSKDYKLLKKELDKLKRQIDDIRVMLWVTMSKEEKERFKKYAEYRRKHKN